MEHRSAESLSWTPAPGERFTGKVLFATLSSHPDALNALGVLFEPGARTNWHTHPQGQVLYVVSGTGRVGTREGELITVGPGDVVHSPAGEVHWHGAGPDSYMMHLSLTTGGETEWLDESVSEEDYERRRSAPLPR